MTFSDYLKMLYPYIGEGRSKADFVVFLTDQIINEPQDIDNNDYNPLAQKGPSILEKMYRGERKLREKDAGIIIANLNVDKFSGYLSTLSDDQFNLIGKALEKNGIAIVNNDVITPCMHLFVSILNDCANEVNMTKDNIQWLGEQFESFNENKVYYNLHEIYKLAENDPQVTSQIREIFGQHIENWRCHFITFRATSDNANLDTTSIDDIRDLLQTIYVYSIEDEMYDEALELYEYLNEYIKKTESDSPNISSFEITELRKNILYLVDEIFDNNTI